MPAAKEPVTIGLIQSDASAFPPKISRIPWPRPNRRRKTGRKSSVGRNCSPPNIFTRARITKASPCPSRSPARRRRRFSCGHAIANGCYVASVNRIGHETPAGGDGIEFWGQSFIADTSGEIIANAGQEETVLLCEIDLAKVDVTRTHWPFLRDRRIDAYGDLDCRLIDE